MNNRPIDTRFRPLVKGIDLEQSLNYLELGPASREFLYNQYTGARLPYVTGSRPRLEKIAQRAVGTATDPLGRVQKLAKFVAKKVRWAGFYQKEHGTRLAVDRDLVEEKLIRSKFGWCNEQARVFCCLTQVLGIPSRLAFAANLERPYGHVISEVLLPDGWLAVDQSFAFLFLLDGRPVCAADIFHAPAARAAFEPAYRQICQDLIDQLGLGIIGADFAMAAAPNPLDGFKDIGFHNHFVR